MAGERRLSGIDARVMREVAQLVALNDREVTCEGAKLLTGMRGNRISDVRVDRKRGKAWIKYEFVRVLETARGA